MSFTLSCIKLKYRHIKSFLSSEANRKLQDTNDHIQGLVDTGQVPSLGTASPMPGRRTTGQGEQSPADCRDGLGGELQKMERMFRVAGSRGSRWAHSTQHILL